MQDVFELVGRTDGEQQSPGEQGIDMKLACLGTYCRTGTIRLRIGPGEQVLETLHSGINILDDNAARII